MAERNKELISRKSLAVSSSFHRTVYSEVYVLVQIKALICFALSKAPYNQACVISFSCYCLQIEEVGWEHLVNLSADLMFISFRVSDKKGRPHILGIQLDKAHPKCPPSVSVDVPYIFTVEWSINSRLKNLVQQFQEHLEKLQEFWSTLDDIDSSVRVVDLKQPSKAISCRQIDIGAVSWAQVLW